jgi:ubiquinone/menaquinone biosynthesis C-methylase UbiE
MDFEIRSPLHEQASITIPIEVAKSDKAFNGTICSNKGDEYTVRNNVVDLVTELKDYSLAQSTNHWKLTAGLYEDLWRKRSLSLLTGEEFPIEKEKELLIEWLAPQADSIYLDVGCSTALYARTVKSSQPESTVVALDFSKEMLNEARLKSEAEESDMFLIRADARHMPFFGKTFDGLMMGGTLNELTDELKVLFECRRVIKDGGTFFMMHLIKADTWYGRLIQSSTEWSGIRFWSIDESNELFSRAGFSVEEQFSKGIVCFTKLKAS